MTLEQDVAAWDGKSADAIRRIYLNVHQTPNFANQVIRLLQENQTQKAATWLLKAFLEEGYVLNSQQTNAVYLALPGLDGWEAKLHVLQCFNVLPITEKTRVIVETFLRNGLMENNKFVRAWSYSGFYHLAQQYPQYLEEAKQLIDMAMRDEAPSVKARIRNVIKKGR